MGRNFTWLTTSGGAWSLASNWNDVSDGIDPSLIVPGPQDDVSVTGPAGTKVQTITGQGDVLAATFAGNSDLAGTFTIGTVTLGAGGGGGLLEIGGGSLAAGTIIVASGDLLASGTSSALSDTAGLTLGAGQTGLGAASCTLDATAGAVVQLAAVSLNASSAALYVDPDSSMEVGTLGGAASGTLTLDAGTTLSGQGNANAYGAVTNNGTILATGGDLLVGTLTGHGLLAIAAGADLTLNGATGAGQAVQFTAAQGTLAVATEFDAPHGTITGFTTGDAIDMLGSPISAATYKATGTGLGVLTLWYGNQVADTLTLAGTYIGDSFLTAGDGALGTFITVAPQTSGGGGGPAPGTSGPDVYQWITNGGGNWKHAGNWQDVTAGQNPAHVAPGANNLVTIDAATSGSFAVIAGPADAASLTLGGDVALSGTFAIGTLAVGLNASESVATLDLLPGTTLTATTAAVGDGALSVSGSAVLSVAGTLIMGGGGVGVGLPVTALSATAGGTITAAGLTLGGGAGDSITTDPTGVIEIGTAGGAIAGAVTVDAGATLAGNGSVNPFGAIVDNGTIAATGGELTLGTVTGAGVLSIGAGAGLALNASDAMPIQFAGAGGELLLADELVSLNGTITGFAQGDAIDIQNDPITAVSTATSGGNTVVSLYYDSTLVNRLTLAGSYSGHFVLAPDGASGTELLLSGNGGGGGGGGQGNTDLLAWATPGSGAWDATANWFDVTTDSAALAPPGTQNPVQITGPTGAAFQTIGGPGNCASLQFFGNSLLLRGFAAGTVTVGGSTGGTLTAGLVDVTASGTSSSLTATVQGGILDGTITVGTGGLLSCGGTFALGDGTPGDSAAFSLLSVSNGGVARLAALALGGGGGDALQTDATGVIEIGTAGGAAAGAVTIDTGITVAGSGEVNIAGLVAVNGTLAAQGGTLAVGAVSGNGALAVGAEATLALTAADSCPIDFTGGGATLVLPGTAETPQGQINGFAAGDAIVTGTSPVSAVAYSPGAGNTGTLTLYDGTAIAGTLLLGGNFAGDIFVVQPDGLGSEISVQPQNGTGPSAGTPTPDDYAWLGTAGSAWNIAANWQDISAGQNPAAVAPGSHDLVTVQGATGSLYTDLVGPADAASLTLLGNVSLSGSYAVGALGVGTAAKAGALALGIGGDVAASFAQIYGDVALQGGVLTSTGTLALDGGALIADAGALVQAAGLALAGGNGLLTVDAASTVEIGSAGGAAAGALTIDPGAILSGAGTVDPTGNILDRGTITAAGGTLVLGDVSGGGTLLVGVGATLALDGTAAAGLLVDFAGPGTLTALTASPPSDIANFADGDAIVLPVSGITDTEYAPTAANLGVLRLLSGSAVVATLNLVGVGIGQSFAATAQGGGTVITTETTDWGGGGGTMRNPQTDSSSGTLATVESASWWSALGSIAQNDLQAMQDSIGNDIAWIDTSADNSPFDPIGGEFGVAVVDQPTAFSLVALPAGYRAMLAPDTPGGTVPDPVWLADAGTGDALLIGNQWNDTIGTTASGDTLVGGTGNTVFFASYGTGAALEGTVSISGGGNDTIITGDDDASITTAEGHRSLVFLGNDANDVVSQGQDTVLCTGGANANDTIWAMQSDTIFTSSNGLTSIQGGNGASAVIANPGTTEMTGGAGNGSIIFCNDALVSYRGGAGSAAIVGGSQPLYVVGGAGAITVFGGTADNVIVGAAGPSFYLVGDGASTVSAASGNSVWLVGASNDSLVATGGNVLLWGANAAGNDVFQAGSGACTISGGSGSDTFLGGAGNATITAGTGAEIFSFTDGLAGGSVTVNGFNAAADTIDLHGYASYGSALVGGSEVITLSDGTNILLNGVASLAGVTILTN